MRILVADDTPIALEYLSEAIQMLGFDVAEASNGEEVLRLAKQERFLALLVDVRMPGMFGDRVLQRLRADPDSASRQSPALAVSSEMNSALSDHLLRCGFAAAFRKPVDLDVLRRALENMLSNDRVVAPPEERPTPSLLDDAAALKVLGRTDVVLRLRRMFSVELAAFDEHWLAWLDQRKAGHLREHLHKLTASCAICGAPSLGSALAVLQAAVKADDWCAASLQQADVVHALAATRAALSHSLGD